MAIQSPKLIFPEGWNERSEDEMPYRGWAEIKVELLDKTIYELTFYAPIRLSQTIQDDFANGESVFSEVNLFVIPEVTRENLQKAVNELYNKGFFKYLKPFVL